MHSIFTKRYLYGMLLLLGAAVSGCSKEDYRPGFSKGTTFGNVHLSGYSIVPLEVHVGPKSAVADTIADEVSGVSLNVPFDPLQEVNRVGFFKTDGLFLTGSQITYNTPGKDTSLYVFYDGKNFVKNPAFPVPANGKRGLRMSFKTRASSYKGPVDVEIHEEYSKIIKVPVLDPITKLPVIGSNGKPKTQDSTIFLIRTEPTVILKDVKSTEFSEFKEAAAPVEPNFTRHLLFIYQAGTKQLLPYPKGVVVPEYMQIDLYYSSPESDDLPGHTAIYVLTDIRNEVNTPNTIDYLMNDVRMFFPPYQ